MGSDRDGRQRRPRQARGNQEKGEKKEAGEGRETMERGGARADGESHTMHHLLDGVRVIRAEVNNARARFEEPSTVSGIEEFALRADDRSMKLVALWAANNGQVRILFHLVKTGGGSEKSAH